jgi:hypothetical protein
VTPAEALVLAEVLGAVPEEVALLQALHRHAVREVGSVERAQKVRTRRRHAALTAPRSINGAGTRGTASSPYSVLKG